MIESLSKTFLTNTSTEIEHIDVDGNAYYYTVSAEGDATITRCMAGCNTMRIPSMLDGHRVRAIGSDAFSSSPKLSAFVKPPAHTPYEHGMAKPRNTQRLAQSYFDLRGSGNNSHLEYIVLPEGLVSVGRAAFRGCNQLSHVELPSTLERIDDLAFSCTNLKRIDLPASCVQLAPLALRTGPETLLAEGAPYRSKIEVITVAASNPQFCMREAILCRRNADGTLEAIACPGQPDVVPLTDDIANVAAGAFDGTYEIGELRIDQGVRLCDGTGLFGNAVCNRLIINGALSLDLEMPDRQLSRRTLAAIRGEAVDVNAIAAAYDAALPAVENRLDRARLMLARLANPVLLDSASKSYFATELKANFDAAIAHFGARGMWKLYDMLVDAGVMGEPELTHAVDVLSIVGDSASVAYLLELKHRQFGADAWSDYDL